MRSKLFQQILDEAPLKTKQKVRDYADNVVIFANYQDGKLSNEEMRAISYELAKRQINLQTILNQVQNGHQD